MDVGSTPELHLPDLIIWQLGQRETLSLLALQTPSMAQSPLRETC